MTKVTSSTNELTTLDGKFRVGDSRDSFTKKRDIKLFDKIDTDGNHILSDVEIVKDREKGNRWHLTAATGGIANIFGLCACAVSLAAPPYSTTPAELALMGVAMTSWGVSSTINAANYHDNKEATEQYKEENGLDVSY